MTHVGFQSPDAVFVKVDKTFTSCNSKNFTRQHSYMNIGNTESQIM